MFCYKVQWDDEDCHRILTRFDAPLTWEAVQAAHDQIYGMMRTMPHQVDWINDISAGPDFPREHMLSNLRYLHRRVPPNAGMNVVVGMHIGPFSRTVMRVFANAVGWPYGFDFADTVEDARQMVQRQRQQSRVSQRSPSDLHDAGSAG
jgi:hypothetical protein